MTAIDNLLFKILRRRRYPLPLRSDEKQPATDSLDVWASIPRPQGLEVAHEGATLPQRKHEEVFRAGLFTTLGRLFTWINAVIRFFGGIIGDKLRRRDTIQRRAQRLRHIIEGVGATFIKLGQQLSIRIDIIPYEYALELEKLLDEVESYLTRDEVEEIIQRASGKSIDEIFLKVDPKPIGSGSVACIYLAELKSNGERVAVKVRRPGIGELFAADMRVLRWLLWCAELFWLPPGFARPVLRELRIMLFEELDFEKEARFTELFGQRVKKAGIRFVTAPVVYFELCSKEVLITEFVTGFWLKDVIKAIECQDDRALATFREQGIDPRRIAQRLIRVARYGTMEGLFYHADLHPANILVHPGNKLTLIDFGSCGSPTERERRIWRHLLFAQADADVGDMAQAALGLFSAIPPIDIEEFTDKLEEVFWQDLYAHKSKHTFWWERSTANMWIGVLRLVREYRIPMNRNLVRLIRMTMLAETLAARLYPGIDHWREYRQFAQAAGRRAERRLLKRLEWFTKAEAWIRYEEAFEMAFACFFRLQDYLGAPVFTLAKIVPLLSYAANLWLRFVLNISLIAFLAVSFRTLWEIAVRKAPWTVLWTEFFFRGWLRIVSQPWYVVIVLALIFINVRRLLLRFDLKDLQSKRV